MDFDATGKKLQQIQADEHDVEQRCQAMFQHWLEGNGVEPVSWNTLIEILEDCKFGALANNVTKHLSMSGFGVSR